MSCFYLHGRNLLLSLLGTNHLTKEGTMPSNETDVMLKQNAENETAYRIALIAAVRNCTVEEAAQLLMQATVHVKAWAA